MKTGVIYEGSPPEDAKTLGYGLVDLEALNAFIMLAKEQFPHRDIPVQVHNRKTETGTRLGFSWPNCEGECERMMKEVEEQWK